MGQLLPGQGGELFHVGRRCVRGGRSDLAEGVADDVDGKVAHVQPELSIADLEDVAELEGVALHGLAVDEGAAAAAVADDNGLFALEQELAMGARDALVGDAVKRLGAAAEHQVGSRLQREDAILVRPGDDKQL